MDRVISLLAALVGLIALGEAILVHVNADAERQDLAAQIAEIRTSLKTGVMPAAEPSMVASASIAAVPAAPSLEMSSNAGGVGVCITGGSRRIALAVGRSTQRVRSARSRRRSPSSSSKTRPRRRRWPMPRSGLRQRHRPPRPLPSRAPRRFRPRRWLHPPPPRAAYRHRAARPSRAGRAPTAFPSARALSARPATSSRSATRRWW